MTDAIIKQSAIEKSFDNLTIVMISFNNLQEAFTSRKMDEVPQTFQIQEIVKQRSSNNSEIKSSVESTSVKSTGEFKQMPTLNKRLNSLVDATNGKDALPPVYNRTPNKADKEIRMTEN